MFFNRPWITLIHFLFFYRSISIRCLLSIIIWLHRIYWIFKTISLWVLIRWIDAHWILNWYLLSIVIIWPTKIQWICKWKGRGILAGYIIFWFRHSEIWRWVYLILLPTSRTYWWLLRKLCIWLILRWKLLLLWHIFFKLIYICTYKFYFWILFTI